MPFFGTTAKRRLVEHKKTRSERNRVAEAVRTARPERSSSPTENQLLATAPSEELNVLRPYLERVELPQREILHEASHRIENVYFLTAGMASLVILTSDGRSVEISIVGREGLVGSPLLAGVARGPYRAIMQISGHGFRIRGELFSELMTSTPELRQMLNKHVLMQGLQIAQIAACNRLHEIDQRLARWLLMCHDRINSEMLPVTHEFLAQMLGTGRPSVSLAAGMLQKGGIIENLRGTVKLVNRKKLEEAACECYGVVRSFQIVTGGSPANK
jgi:CRP-like cAMP-binding protein